MKGWMLISSIVLMPLGCHRAAPFVSCHATDANRHGQCRQDDDSVLSPCHYATFMHDHGLPPHDDDPPPGCRLPPPWIDHPDTPCARFSWTLAHETHFYFSGGGLAYITPPSSCRAPPWDEGRPEAPPIFYLPLPPPKLPTEDAPDPGPAPQEKTGPGPWPFRDRPQPPPPPPLDKEAGKIVRRGREGSNTDMGSGTYSGGGRVNVLHAP